MGIADFLGLSRQREPRDAKPSNLHAPETDTVRKIVAALDQMDEERARFIAAFAYILCRVARADLHISEGETQLMERVVRERGNLPEEQAILIVQMAKTQSILFGGTENFVVTREFNRIATHEQKLALLDCLFAVSSDNLISTAEEAEIAKIAAELKLSHDEMISVRSAYREHRAVLRPPPSKQ
jgi:uncharacterized tellurite resistance protein B-like protein